jgi:hypothetical protein
MTKTDLHDLNQSQFAEYAGVSRQNISALIKKGEIIKKENGKIDIDDPVNAFYLDGRKDAPRVVTNPKGAKGGPADLPGDKPVKPKPKKRGRPKKTDPKSAEEKPVETNKPSPPQGEEGPSLQKQKLQYEVDKLREQKIGLKMDNAKKRGQLFEIESLGETVFGYISALNQNIMEMPASFLDELEAALKSKKSRAERLNIITAPICEAIAETKEEIQKEIKKAKRELSIKNKEDNT